VASDADGDVEQGEGVMGQLNQFGSWATAMGSKVSESARSIDFNEQTKGIQSQVSKGFGQVAAGATQATGALTEKGKEARAMAKDIGSKGQEQLSKAKQASAEKAKMAKDKAAQAASGAKGALSSAGSSLSGLTALTMSPMKLAQFGGVFFLGVLLITMSFTFLPVFVIAPQKFALLFAFGSMTMMGSLTMLKGPAAFLAAVTARSQLPFTALYVVGLVGTLVATIVMKSFILTAIFGLTQVSGLLYFLASFVPGGKAALNACQSCCSKTARMIAGQVMGS